MDSKSFTLSFEDKSLSARAMEMVMRLLTDRVVSRPNEHSSG
jgi:hypothetical protein